MYLLTDPEKLEKSMAKPDRLTETEKQLWRAINRQEAPPT
jgi:hypothetical protein